MTTADSPVLPGRLGTPTMVLNDDPRADPRMLAALAPLGIGGPAEVLPFDHTAPLEALMEYCAAAEEGFNGLGGATPSSGGIVSGCAFAPSGL